MEPAGECYTFFYGRENENQELGTSFSVHKGIISAVKRVEFVSDRMLYIFRICHQEGPRKPGGIEIKWDASAVGLCR
jgi:hypothetical protein